MKIPKIFCFYCGKAIKEKGNNNDNSLSMHHIFNYNDIKYRLMRIFKEPVNSKEHENIQNLIKLISDNLPKFPVHSKCHKEIEKKIS
jgi:uncharacterized Fe-S cluster-containing protein